MKYELTVTLRLDSRCSQERVARQFEDLFESGTIRESIAEGLHLRDDPHLVSVSVLTRQGREKD
jgi:hypothetical protein